MTLHPCARCRRHIDATAASCPFCASSVKRHPVRSSLATIGKLSRAAVFAGAAACYTGASTTTTTTTTPPPPPDPTETQTFAKPPAPAPGRATVSGILRIDGQPSPSSTIRLVGDSGVTSSTTTDLHGRYTFRDLEPGGYRLTFDAYFERSGPPQAYVTLAADANVDYDFVVTSPPPDMGPCCKPYGAPPARRRVV